MKQRVVVVYNPRSSRAGRVESEVLARLPEAVRYEVVDTDVDDNARRLAKILRDGDRVVSAGGDATAVIGVNGVMLSGVEAEFVALPFGNFNDTARGLKMRGLDDVLTGEVREVWPLEMIVDGEHFRYDLAYFTVGMFAEATEIFDRPKYRKRLQTGRKGVGYSMRILARWWMLNRRKEFLPGLPRGVTDYVALNSVSMARVMKGKRWFFGKKFLRRVGKMGGVLGLLRVMVPSVLWGVPGTEVRRDSVDFGEEVEVMVQGGGEYKRMRMRGFEVVKEKSLKVVMRG